MYVELPYGDETRAVPICKEITSGFHVEAGLQLLATVADAVGDAAQAGSHEITCTHAPRNDGANDVSWGCDMAVSVPTLFQQYC